MAEKNIDVHLLLRSTNVNLLSNSLKLNVNEDFGTRITAFSHYFHYVGHLAGLNV